MELPLGTEVHNSADCDDGPVFTRENDVFAVSPKAPVLSSFSGNWVIHSSRVCAFDYKKTNFDSKKDGKFIFKKFTMSIGLFAS